MQFSLQLVSKHWKKNHCKLQETCYTLQSWTAASYIFKKSLQSLQEAESSSAASVRRCIFLCNLCCNGVARKVAGRLQRATFSRCNLSCNFFRLAAIAQSRARFYFLQQLHGICFEQITCCSS